MSGPQASFGGIETQASYASMVEGFASGDLKLDLDLQGSILRVEPSTVAASRFPQEKLAGTRFVDVLHVDDQQRAEQAFQTLLEGGLAPSFECRMIAQDGASCWFVCHYVKHEGGDGVSVLGRDVSAKRLEEQRLLTWHQRHESAAHIGRRVVFEWDAATDRMIWAGACTAMFGMSIHEIESSFQEWLQRVHPADIARARDSIEGCRARRESTHLEYRVRDRHGRYLWVRCDAQYMASSTTDTQKDAADRVIGCLTDITESRRLEQRFQSIVESVPAGILITDSDGCITFLNPQVEKLFGYNQNELLGQFVEVLIPERFRDEHSHQRKEYVTRPEPRPVGTGRVLWGRRRDGSEFPVDVSLAPIDDPPNVSVVVTVIDLTDRIAADVSIRSSEERLRAILDNTSAVVYVKDVEGRYQLVNRRFAELFDVTQEDVQGKTDFEVFPPEMADAFQENDRWVAMTGEVLKIEEIAPHDEGPRTYISVKFPIHDHQGNVYAVGGISTDITERVRAAAELTSFKVRLEAILNAIGDGVIGLDESGQTQFANAAARAMLGDDLLGAFEHCGIGLVGNVDGEGAGRSMRWLIDREGTRFPAEVTIRPLEGDTLHPGRMISFRDVSDRHRRRRMESELASAHAVQQILLPQSSPTVPGFDISGHVFPADRMSGDYLDFLPVNPEETAVAVGDVSGHGFGPALEMVETRAYVRAMVGSEGGCDRILRKLNSYLHEDTVEGSFVTMFLAMVHHEARTVRYCGAGHDAWLIRADGHLDRLVSSGLVLGLLPNVRYEEPRPVQLNTGDVLVILTDGVYETLSTRRELFGQSRMLESLLATRHESAEQIVNRLYLATREFAQGEPQNDDVTIAVIKAE